MRWMCLPFYKELNLGRLFGMQDVDRLHWFSELIDILTL